MVSKQISAKMATRKSGKKRVERTTKQVNVKINININIEIEIQRQDDIYSFDYAMVRTKGFLVSSN